VLCVVGTYNSTVVVILTQEQGEGVYIYIFIYIRSSTTTPHKVNFDRNVDTSQRRGWRQLLVLPTGSNEATPGSRRIFPYPSHQQVLPQVCSTQYIQETHTNNTGTQLPIPRVKKIND